MSEPDDLRSPMWLAHHWPDQYDRCVVVGRRRVCRRCLVLYPVAFVVAALAALGASVPEPWSQLLLVLLPLPALVDFVGEHRGWWRHSRTRLVALTVPLGVGAGIGFGRYLADHADPWFWGTVAVYGAVSAGVALIAPRIGREHDEAGGPS